MATKTQGHVHLYLVQSNLDLLVYKLPQMYQKTNTLTIHLLFHTGKYSELMVK